MSTTAVDMQKFYWSRPVMVTGGAGFIGTHLVNRLKELGADVTVVDDFSSSSRETRWTGYVRCHRMSVLDPEFSAVIQGIRTVFHLAAVSSVPECTRRPGHAWSVNVGGTAAVLAEAARVEVKRVVFASSAAVYGSIPRVPTRECDRMAPASVYATSKVAGEALARYWAQESMVDSVILRLFNVYGPGQEQSEGAVVPAFMRALRAGTPPQIHGRGDQIRDYVHVADVVAAMLLAGAREDHFLGHEFNVGTGQPTSVLELLEMVSMMAGDFPVARNTERRGGDVNCSVADTTEAKTILGFTAQVPLRQGLAAMIKLGGPGSSAAAPPAPATAKVPREG